jgi:microcystin-dependent protein
MAASSVGTVIVAPNAGDNGGSPFPVGSVQMFAGIVAPSGWLVCRGQAVSRRLYADLFNVIGTTYGPGDGTTTYNLPDTAGRVIRGSDVVSWQTGQTGGADTVNLSVANLPPHSHSYNNPTNINFAPSLAGQNGVNGSSVGQTGASIQNAAGTQIVASDGSGQTAVNVVNSYLAMPYIIKF